MSFRVVLWYADPQYEIIDQSAGLGPRLESMLGDVVSASNDWGSGPLAASQFGTITFTYSSGMTTTLYVEGVSSTSAVLHDVDIWTPQGDFVMSYVGELQLTPDTLTQVFNDATALAGDDSIDGNLADNILEGYGGDDTIDGDAGVDTVVLRGLRSAYTVAVNGGTITTSGPDGRDTLTSVERLRFDDSSLAFDWSGEAGQAYRLYQTALNRAPDAGGLGYYIHTLDAGWHLHDIAGNFLQSPEFIQKYGATTDVQFVNLLYQNVLHRAGEASGVQFHVNELASGMDRAQLLINFSESPENQANLVGVAALGMAYVPQ